MTASILALLAAGISLFYLVLLVRAWDAASWRRSLVCYRLHLPRELAATDVAAWLAGVAAQTLPPRFSLLHSWPVGLEIEATEAGISHTLLVPKSRQPAVLAGLRAALPGVRLDELPDTEAPKFRAAIELRLTSQRLSLGDDRAVIAANGLLASMQPLPVGAVIRVQWLFAGVRATRRAVSSESDTLHWLLRTSAEDRDRLREERQKQRAPLLLATGRVATAAESKAFAFAAVHRAVGAMRVLEAPGVHFLWRLVPSWLAARRTARRQLPLLAWPLTLNTLEAAGLVGLPLNGAALPGVRLGSSRQVPPSPDTPTTGAVSTYPGSVRPLAIRPRDRLMHSYVLGPSGTGKSTLLANLALQDIAAGHGVVVIDPKADLVTDILARFPAERRDSLLVLDPSDRARPVGFNPLRPYGDEHSRELAPVIHDRGG